jgi:hypothetical protein
MVLFSKRSLIPAVVVMLVPSAALACSCANPIPIEATQRRYSERAVFTAYVVQLMGSVSLWNGKRSSGKALAVVHQRYWGLPWYWPKVVVLDGGLFCGMLLNDGVEYLVSGVQTRYGVVDVSACSRTQPLESAQVDLRTLDGSHCAAPGGTLIGRVTKFDEDRQQALLVRNARLTFRDSYGRAYQTESDGDGIYEMRHLSPGPYVLDSQFGSGKYVLGAGEVTSGVCQDSFVRSFSYAVTGQLIPGIGFHAQVDLVGIHQESPTVRSAIIAPDGRFYFQSVPPGDYYLKATFDLHGRFDQVAPIYYPGVNAREKAVVVRVSDQPLSQSFDFNSDTLPLVPIPIVVESPNRSHPLRVWIRSQDSNGNIVAENSGLAGLPMPVFGVRGQSYGITVYSPGNEQRREQSDSLYLRSKVVQVQTVSGMKRIVIVLNLAE